MMTQKVILKLIWQTFSFGDAVQMTHTICIKLTGESTVNLWQTKISCEIYPKQRKIKSEEFHFSESLD